MPVTARPTLPANCTSPPPRTVSDELETTSIPAQRIRSLIDNARTTKVALILDCCYSGAIEKTFLRGDVEDQLNLMAGGRGTFIMTAATDVQTAREEVRDGYGIFTKHLIDGIRGPPTSMATASSP